MTRNPSQSPFRKGNYPLDTITTKLDRAHEHLEVFNSAVRDFHESHPYDFSNKFEPKGDNIYDWVFTVHVRHELPLRISAIFGDGIQNTRTVLDYLACQLSIIHTGDKCDLNGVAFPIFNDPNRYMAMEKGIQRNKGRVWTSSGLYKIRYIDPKAQTVIENLQPYKGGDNILLGQLQSLSDIDKHRHLHIVSPPFGEWSAGIPLGDGFSPEPLKGLTIRSSIFKRSFKDGAEIARFEVAVAPGFDFKVRVNHRIPGDVVLDEITFANGLAGFILAGLIGFVRKKVIPQLSPFLG